MSMWPHGPYDDRVHPLIEAMQQAVVATDLAGRVTYWNASAEQLYGWSAADVMGRDVYEFLRPRSVSLNDEPISAAISSGRSWSGEFTVQHRDGSPLAIFVTVSPIHDADRTLIGVVSVAEDATERRRTLDKGELRDAEQRLRSLFTHHPDAVFALDCDGRYTVLNPACERLSGVAPEDLVGTRFGEHTLEREKVEKGLRMSLAGQSLTFEATLIRRTKPVVPVQLTLVPILINGSTVGVYGITKDISERKRIEHRLAMQAREQMTIADLGLLALTDIGTNELMRITVEVVAATLDVSNVVLLGFAPESATFWLCDGVGVPQPLIETSLDSPALQMLIEYTETRRVNGRELETLFGVQGVDFGKRPAGLASRIPGRDANHGLIIAWSRRARTYSDDDMRFLQHVSIVLGAAIDHYVTVEELRRRESEFKVLVEHTSDHIARFDQLARFLYVNPALQRMLGVPAANLLNRNLRDVVGILPHDTDSWERAVRRVFRTGEDEELEIVYGDRCYSARFSPEFGPDQDVISVLGVARDITADRRREAERSKLYQELLERDERLHDLMERLLLDQRQPRRSRLQAAPAADQFSTRDRHILRLLARGMTNREIARELGLRPSTVKNYVANLLPRLNASDRTNAAVVAAQWGLLGGDAE